MTAEELEEAADADESYPMTAEDYKRWLAGHHAQKARGVAADLRKPPADRDGLWADSEIADLFDNLAAIAEREAGRES